MMIILMKENALVNVICQDKNYMDHSYYIYMHHNWIDAIG